MLRRPRNALGFATALATLGLLALKRQNQPPADRSDPSTQKEIRLLSSKARELNLHTGDEDIEKSIAGARGAHP